METLCDEFLRKHYRSEEAETLPRKTAPAPYKQSKIAHLSSQ